MNTVFNQDSVHNVNIQDEKVLLTPQELKQEFPLPDIYAIKLNVHAKRFPILFTDEINAN